jgi:hypothetical protein
MYHALPRNSSFWLFLFSVDQDLAEATRKGDCPCGGRLHRADYPRKPCGTDGLPEQYRTRLSFCCARDGCRKRRTPPTVRFLGRKVYLGAIVVLVAAMRQGPTPRRVRELCEHFGCDRRTIGRWRAFWEEHFPQTQFWKIARGGFSPALDMAAALPRALLEVFVRNAESCEEWGKLLCFLSPITITGGLKIKIS